MRIPVEVVVVVGRIVRCWMLEIDVGCGESIGYSFDVVGESEDEESERKH